MRMKRKPGVDVVGMIGGWGSEGCGAVCTPWFGVQTADGTTFRESDYAEMLIEDIATHIGMLYPSSQKVNCEV